MWYQSDDRSIRGVPECGRLVKWHDERYLLRQCQTDELAMEDAACRTFEEDRRFGARLLRGCILSLDMRGGGTTSRSGAMQSWQDCHVLCRSTFQNVSMKDDRLCSLQVGGATPTRGSDKDMSKYLSAVLPWIRGSRRDSVLAFVRQVGTAAVMLAFEGLVRRMT
jgi:hypothetical protein